MKLHDTSKCLFLFLAALLIGTGAQAADRRCVLVEGGVNRDLLCGEQVLKCVCGSEVTSEVVCTEDPEGKRLATLFKQKCRSGHLKGEPESEQ